jgi:hypothetical protein
LNTAEIECAEFPGSMEWIRGIHLTRTQGGEVPYRLVHRGGIGRRLLDFDSAMPGSQEHKAPTTLREAESFAPEHA